jgi:hypothetical protein
VILGPRSLLSQHVDSLLRAALVFGDVFNTSVYGCEFSDNLSNYVVCLNYLRTYRPLKLAFTARGRPAQRLLDLLRVCMYVHSWKIKALLAGRAVTSRIRSYQRNAEIKT